MLGRTLLLLLVCCGSVIAQARSAELVAKGSVWRYLDDGSDQGTAWSSPSFDDSAWPQGPAQLGYGDGDEATLIRFGPDPVNKYVTTYLRHTFVAADASLLRRACLWLLCDDGAVVYLNGVEVARHNMPSGPVGYTSLATSAITSTIESAFFTAAIDAAALRTGTNVLAVELHQVHVASSDVSFDLRLVATDGSPCVVRGPYVQRCASTSAVLRWRTDLPVASVAWLGPTPALLTLAASDPTPKTEHELAVPGLAAATRYFYAVGDAAGPLAGGDASHSVRTAPPPGAPVPFRAWVLGDSGTADVNAQRVRDAYLAYAASTPTDVILMLGDNAYDRGLDIEYQAGVFDTYASVLRDTCVWPSLGNHDAISASSTTQTGPYFTAFTLPAQGEAGGVPSGTEAYYSFDYGAAHFVCLDSEGSDRRPGGPMLTWLQADLTSAQQSGARWIVAYCHHPPYTKGSHDSDNLLDSDGRMQALRQNVLPLLEAFGVDLVLAGHSHGYERSFLLDGHYGFSSTLTPAMLLDKGDGDAASDGVYVKDAAGMAPHQGTVYVVAGSSAKLQAGPMNHPAMAVAWVLFGSVVLDFNGNQLDASFLDSQGQVRDRFAIHKGVTRTLTRDWPRIAVSTGGVQTLTLDAAATHAGLAYLVAGSLGTTPGVPLPPVHVPLNPDAYMAFTIQLANSSVYLRTAGLLDPAGQASAAIALPPLSVSLVGQTLWHAYVVYDPSTGTFQHASNPVRLLLIP